MTAAPRRSPAAATLGVLGALYFVQGLPYGFQSNALPLFLREAGMSLTGVGLTGLLSLPWLLKPLWAPLVDRFGSPRFGRRKSWIVPLQVLLALACCAAAFCEPRTCLQGLLVVVLGLNLITATQDIAVDGLTVSSLSSAELGLGNTAQVVGYKVGMLAGGGVLVALSGLIGWRGMFFSMAAFSLLVMGVLLAWPEPPARTADGQAVGPPRFAELVSALWAAARQPGFGWLLVFVATYKFGEVMADKMFGPYVLDHGYTAQQVGGWLGTWGMLASLLGSTVGGVLASRARLLTAVSVSASVRVVPLALQWAMVSGVLALTPVNVVAVVCAEHFFGGALTTAMFAFMMSRVDRRIGATHYTLLAAVEVFGKSPAGVLSGVVADRAGYPTVFAVAVLASVAFLLVLRPMHRGPPAVTA